MIWLQTYTGKKFTPLDPRPEDICAEDIAHALGNMCRFNGHCKRFYSVAEHSIRVAELAPDCLLRLALLHDAAEVYLTDMPRPLKSAFPEFSIIERRIRACILERFNVSLDGWEEVEYADMIMLATEARDLMSEPPCEWDPMPMPLELEIDEIINPLSYKDLWLELFNA